MKKKYGAEALLASSIPDLELHSGALNVQSADFLRAKDERAKTLLVIVRERWER